MSPNPAPTMNVLVEDDLRVRGRGADNNKITWKRVSIPTQELTVNMNLFLDDVEHILDNTPEKVGKFKLDEISVSAEVTAEGKVVLCGIGGQMGITGGFQFVFKRNSEK